MKTTSLLFGLAVVLSCGCSSKKTEVKKITQVEWLVGYWERTNAKEGRSAHERWEKISDTELTGWGVSTQNGDTTFVEKLHIVAMEDGLYYGADVPENPEVVYFKFTSTSADGFFCENLQHDFPKKIQYELRSDTLIATTSGNGKKLVFGFVKSSF